MPPAAMAARWNKSPPPPPPAMEPVPAAVAAATAAAAAGTVPIIQSRGCGMKKADQIGRPLRVQDKSSKERDEPRRNHGVVLVEHCAASEKCASPTAQAIFSSGAAVAAAARLSISALLLPV